MQYDGVATQRGNGFSTSPDLAPYDRVKILRGPAGLFYGAGQPGGTVNLVRKRPTPYQQLQVQARAGSWDFKRLNADLGPRTTLGAGLNHERTDSVPCYIGLPRYSNGVDLSLPRLSYNNGGWSVSDIRNISSHRPGRDDLGIRPAPRRPADLDGRQPQPQLRGPGPQA